MAVMTSKEFIQKCEEILAAPTVYYSKAGGDWAKWNGSKWQFDCVILIKAILWGFSFDKNASHGGAVYKANGVADFGTEQMMSYCTDVSTDFSKLTPGELLWCSGHAGVYIGNGKVIECTVAWSMNKVVKSEIDSSGTRTYNGRKAGNMWKKHGKCKYISYTSAAESPQSTTNTGTASKTEKAVSKSRIHDWQHTAYKCGFFKGTIDGVWGNVSERALKTGKAYVKKGSNNIWVLFVQQVLKYHGFYTGTQDKSFGSMTDTAVRKYQKSRGLYVDGYVGYKTWRKMLGVD